MEITEHEHRNINKSRHRPLANHAKTLTQMVQEVDFSHISVSHHIKICAEVEKVWIIFDCYNKGSVVPANVVDYVLKTCSLNVPQETLEEIFENIEKTDDELDEKLTKKELFAFFYVLLLKQPGIKMAVDSKICDQFCRKD